MSSDRASTVYSTDGKGNINQIRSYPTWSKDWFRIVRGRFSSGPGTKHDLLFYDRVKGIAKYFKIDGQGQFKEIGTHNMKKTWDIVLSGKFSNNQYSGLFLYDRRANEYKVFESNGSGGLKLLNSGTLKNRPTHIVKGSFKSGSKFTDLLFYDKFRGIGEFASTDGKGNISTFRNHNTWRKTWDIILTGNFSNSGTGLIDLLFYESSTRDGNHVENSAHAKFFRTDGKGGLIQIKHHTNWPRGIQIITGSFGIKEGNTPLYDPLPIPEPGEGLIVPDTTDLLFYYPHTGRAKFYRTDGGGSGNITLLKEHTGWKRGIQIISGKFTENTSTPRFSDLLFYDNRYYLAVRGVKLRDDDRYVNGQLIRSYATTITSDEFQQWVDYANQIYASAGIVLTFDHDIDWDDLEDTSLNRMDRDLPEEDPSMRAANEYADLYQRKIVVYCRFGRNNRPNRSGGGFSWGSWKWVVMSDFSASSSHRFYSNRPTRKEQQIDLFAHELGHYLGLPHNFVGGLDYRFGWELANDDDVLALLRLTKWLPGLQWMQEWYNDVARSAPDRSVDPQRPNTDRIVINHGSNSMEIARNANSPIATLTSKNEILYQFRVITTDPVSGESITHLVANPLEDGVRAYLIRTRSITPEAFDDLERLDSDQETILDTPPDCGRNYFTLQGFNPADLGREVTVDIPDDGINIRSNPDRYNIMSRYSNDEYHRISPDQIRRIREHLHSEYRLALIRNQITGNGP